MACNPAKAFGSAARSSAAMGASLPGCPCADATLPAIAMRKAAARHSPTRKLLGARAFGVEPAVLRSIRASLVFHGFMTFPDSLQTAPTGLRECAAKTQSGFGFGARLGRTTHRDLVGPCVYTTR